MSGLFLGIGATSCAVPLSRLNRHVLVSGATGTGKTVSLLGMAQRLSDAGVPVFFPDVKGDVSALARVSPVRRLSSFRIAARSVSSALFARALSLSPVQSGTLEIVWSAIQDADTAAYDDLAGIRSAVRAVQSSPASFASLGRVSAASCGVIMRALLGFERRGGSTLLGSPGFDVAHLLDLDSDGRGFVSILPAVELSRDGGIYSLALLYVLDELFERLPEVGDLDLPRAVLIFDEAHLIFTDATPEIVRDIARKVRLIRSKGIGLVFASQSPADIPSEILSQLGTRIQHGLRAASPVDARALKVAADTMPRGNFDMVDTIRRLPTGSAVVSAMRDDGSPSSSVVVRMIPPTCDLSPVDLSSAPDVPPRTTGEAKRVEPGPGDFEIGLGVLLAGLGLLLAAVRYAIG